MTERPPQPRPTITVWQPYASLEASALRVHVAAHHQDHCPHGMPSKASCLDCMNETGVADPQLAADGRAERADSHPIIGKYDKDCPVCSFQMLGTKIVHTTKNRWTHQHCVDRR